jgi:hypothetical protein
VLSAVLIPIVPNGQMELVTRIIVCANTLQAQREHVEQMRAILTVIWTFLGFAKSMRLQEVLHGCGRYHMSAKLLQEKHGAT